MNISLEGIRHIDSIVSIDEKAERAANDGFIYKCDPIRIPTYIWRQFWLVVRYLYKIADTYNGYDTTRSR
jgi:hypothetical protein